MKGSALEVCPSQSSPLGQLIGVGKLIVQLAIVSNSKHFLSLPLIQHLVRQIYTGHLVYSPQSSRSLISDSYISDRTRIRRRPSHSSLHHPSQSPSQAREEDLVEVYTYNPYESGWLDHQRLRVPKWRKWLDFISFVILMSLFVATLARMSLLLFSWVFTRSFVTRFAPFSPSSGP
jgi:hypothetical protein